MVRRCTYLGFIASGGRCPSRTAVVGSHHRPLQTGQTSGWVCVIIFVCSLYNGRWERLVDAARDVLDILLEIEIRLGNLTFNS